MKSALPKVLHRLAGRPLLQHVLDSAATLDPLRSVVVTGHGAEAVEALASAVAGAGGALRFARQMPQLGTGHAVQQALPQLDEAAETTLILNGDVPLVSPQTMRALVQASAGKRLALLTVELADPSGYGRILRQGEQVQAIVEHKDASPAQRALREVYTGIMAAPTAALRRWLGLLRNDNAQGEYYLTDIVALAVAEGTPVLASPASSETEVLGVNSPLQLAQLERRVQQAQAEALLEAGVRLADPARLDIRGRLHCGQDVEIDVNCVFEGEVHLGDGVRIGANCVIRNAVIGAGTRIAPFSHIEDTTMGAACVIGPYARTRPGTKLGQDVHVGNFVEIKNSRIDDHSKANHLAYVGDADVGQRVNIGAGTITCNYDGANKFRTVIEDDVFIGSDTQLVAPVRVGRGATLGAGTTLTRDAPPEQLTVSRSKQLTVPGWKRPTKK